MSIIGDLKLCASAFMQGLKEENVSACEERKDQQNSKRSNVDFPEWLENDKSDVQFPEWLKK